LLQGLEALGHVEGRTFAIELRHASGKAERLPEAAAELVSLKPDLLFTVGAEVAPVAKNATQTIPIVMVLSSDPVQAGLVDGLGRPGGNITGVTFVSDQLSGKTVEFLKAASPQVSRVAMLWNPDHADPDFRETQRAAAKLGMQLQSLTIRGPADIDGAL